MPTRVSPALQRATEVRFGGHRQRKASERRCSTPPAGPRVGRTRSSTRALCCGTAARSPKPRRPGRARFRRIPITPSRTYQLGMALVNEGNLAGAATEFETYLKLAPDGSNAATAKSLVGQLKNRWTSDFKLLECLTQ